MLEQRPGRHDCAVCGERTDRAYHERRPGIDRIVCATCAYQRERAYLATRRPLAELSARGETGMHTVASRGVW